MGLNDDFLPRLDKRTVSARILATAQQSLHRGYEVLRRCRFRHAHNLVVSRPVVFSGAVSAVQHARDVSFFQPFAKLRTLAIAERVIQDDGRRNLGLYGNERAGE